MQPLIPYFEQPILRIPMPPGLPFDHIPLHGFGLLVAVGFLVGAKVAMDRARRVGLDADAINRLVGWLVLGTFVGGHVGYGLMYRPQEYLADPIQFLYLWQGLSSFGGIVTCIGISIVFFRKNKLPIWPYLDNLAIGFAVGWFFGRMGCFVAHDHPGTVTSFWLGQYGICAEAFGDTSVACHDMGLYEALFSLSLFGLFLLLDRRPRVPGFYPALLGILYAPTRFFMDFLRPDVTDVRYMGFTPGQYWSVLLGLLALGLLLSRLRSGDEPVWAPRGAPAAPPEDEPPREGDAAG